MRSKSFRSRVRSRSKIYGHYSCEKYLPAGFYLSRALKARTPNPLYDISVVLLSRKGRAFTITFVKITVLQSGSWNMKTSCFCTCLYRKY